MSFGALVQQIASNRNIHDKFRNKSTYNKLETGEGTLDTRQNNFGTEVQDYYVNLIHLFDRAITNFDLHQLSVEQQKLLERYFKQANSITREHTNALNQAYVEDDFSPEVYVSLYETMDNDIQRLDKFLGSYFGDDYGTYSRYGDEEQLHSQRQSISKKVKPTK